LAQETLRYSRKFFTKLRERFSGYADYLMESEHLFIDSENVDLVARAGARGR
jgi:hypothetical protein